MVNHTLFLANILDFLLCLPSTLSFGFITSQSNFNSATKSGWRKIHSSADLHHVKNMITNFKWALVFTLQSGYISYLHFLNISQFSSVTQSGPTLQPHQVQHARPPFPSLSLCLLKLISTESVMPSSHLLCRPLLILPPIPPSIRVFFQWVNSLHQVAKVLEFQLQHQSFQWTPRTDLL